MATIQQGGDHLAQSHADQPIGLYEPGETAHLGQNKGPKRCVAIHSTQPWRHSTSRPPVSWPCRDATHGKHVGGPTNTVPIRPQGLAQPCYLSHSWGFGVRVFLLLAFVHLKDTHKAVGQGLVVCQGVSAHRWAITHYLWGPLLLRDPPVFGLGPQGTQYPCVATWRHTRSLDNREAVYWQGRRTHKASFSHFG